MARYTERAADGGDLSFDDICGLLAHSASKMRAIEHSSRVFAVKQRHGNDDAKIVAVNKYLKRFFGQKFWIACKRLEFALENQSERHSVRPIVSGKAQTRRYRTNGDGKRGQKCHFIFSPSVPRNATDNSTVRMRECDWAMCWCCVEPVCTRRFIVVDSSVFAIYRDCISFDGLFADSQWHDDANGIRHTFTHIFLSERKFRCKYSNAFPDNSDVRQAIKPRLNGK